MCETCVTWAAIAGEEMTEVALSVDRRRGGLLRGAVRPGEARRAGSLRDGMTATGRDLREEPLTQG